MKLAYRAFERSGREVTDVIDAPTMAEATDRLRHQELFVAEIVPADEGAAMVSRTQAPAPTTTRRVGETKRLKNMAMFTRQLFVLMKAGTPLAEGLRAMERQTKDAAWRKVVENLRKHLERGVSLSKSMETRPEYFDQIYRNMIAAGESAGKLTTVLDRLAQLIRRRLQVRRTIRGAMIYPTLLVFVSFGVFAAMLILVVPRFAELFESLDMPLPPTTSMLIAFSEFLVTW